MRIPSGLVAMMVLGLLPFSALASETYVHAGKVLDVTSGRLIEDQMLVIRDGRIVEIGSTTAIHPAEGTVVHDLSKQVVMPGLIELHTHLFGDAEIHGYRRLAVSLPAATIKAVKNAKLTLDAGFTTARVPGAPGFADVALRDSIEKGVISGPRLIVAGPSIGITGGHCSDNNLLPFEEGATGVGVADGPWEVRRAVRRNIKYGADFIKTCATGGVLSKGTEVGSPQYTLEELTALVEEAHSHGRKVAAHAHGATGIRNALLAGVDSIEHASFIDDEGLALAKKNGTVLVIDIYNTEYILGEGEKAGFLPESLEKERRVGAQQRESFRRAHEAGVKIAFGTDGGVYPHGQNARQLSRMVQFGMTPIEAIRSATVNAAELLGMSASLGTLEIGKYADMIAVNADPLAEIETLENVVFVMRNGEVMKPLERTSAND